VSGDVATITLASTPTGGNQRVRNCYTGVLDAGGGTAGQPHSNIRNDETQTGQGSGSTLYDWSVAFDEPVGFNWNPTTSSISSASGLRNSTAVK
jgi:hypothetical protein